MVAKGRIVARIFGEKEGKLRRAWAALDLTAGKAGKAGKAGTGYSFPLRNAAVEADSPTEINNLSPIFQSVFSRNFPRLDALLCFSPILSRAARL
jgi:hypothetical protein